MHEGDTNGDTIKKEKKKRKKKKYYQRESDQSNEVCSTNVSVPYFHEEKAY